MPEINQINRRAFLRGLTATSVGLAMAREAFAEQQAKSAGQAALPAAAPKPAVNVAVIGLGNQGKEILRSLAKMGAEANVSIICDTFEAPTFVKKASAITPSAQFVKDYRKALENPAVQGVFIATPTHLHKQITLDAIQAGKHVYLEAPLAHTVEDARAIAAAGAASKKIFQPGLQVRCNAQALHVRRFVRGPALGTPLTGRAQYHKRDSWKVQWPTDERMKELNWRLDPAVSAGLAGEVGIHQFDTASWYFNIMPEAVQGFGAVVAWPDGRRIPDTIQLVLEFPRNLRYLYDATLGSSFDSAYELFQGTASTIMLRDQRAWMVKEQDADLLGWEVFARKDSFQIGVAANGTGVITDTGIALVANATKQIALGKEPGKVGTDVTKTSIYQAAASFLDSVRLGKPAFAKEPSNDDPKPPTIPGALDGYRATVLALKANEAVLKNTRIVLEKSWFDLA